MRLSLRGLQLRSFTGQSWRCKRLRLRFLFGRGQRTSVRFSPSTGLFAPLVGIFEENFMHNILPHRRPLGENAETMFQMVAAIVCFCLIGVLLAL